MTVMLKVETTWGGFTGAPGFTNLYWRPGTGGGSIADASDCAARVRAFFATLAARLTTATFLQVSGTCDAIEDSTGALVGQFTGTTPAVLTGSGGTSAAPRGTAWVLSATTSLVVGGRFLRGRTFLAPLNAASFDTTGNTTGTGPVTTGATAMLTGGSTLSFPVIWHRPGGAAAPIGTSGPVTGYAIPSTPAILRSRRD